MSTETSGKYYFKGNFWSGGVIIDEYSVIQDENGDWWKYTGYRRTKPFNVMAGEKPDSSSWINVGTLMASGVTEQDVTFDKGGTIENKNQFVLDNMSGMWYYWNGSVPKQVPAGSDVTSTGGVGADAWLPIEGLISQNLSNIRALQQLVSDQSDTITLLTDMQHKQAGVIDNLQSGQSTQEQSSGTQSQAITDITGRIAILEKDTSGGLSAMDALAQNLSNTSKTTDSNAQSISIINNSLSDMSQMYTRQNQSITDQNGAISNQQSQIDAIKKTALQAQDTVSNQQQSITSLQNSQLDQDKRIDDNNSRDDKQDTQLSSHEDHINTLQGKVTAVEQLSNNQSTSITGLDSRLTAQEKTSADQSNIIKGQNDKLTAYQQRLSTAETTSTQQQSDIDMLKTTQASQGNTLTSTGQQVKTNTDDITALKKSQTDQDTLIGNNSKSLSGLQLTLQTTSDSVSSLQTRVDGIGKALSDQAAALSAQATKIQSNTDTLAAQGQQIASQGTTLSSQGNAISTLQTTLTTQGNALSTLQTNATASQKQLNTAVDNISSLQTAVGNKFNTPAGTTSQYIRGDGTLATFPVSKRTFTYPTRSLNTAFQISATQDSHVFYTIDITVASVLITGTSGRIYLEYADDQAMKTNVVIVSEVGRSVSGVLNITSLGSGNVQAWIPAGKYVRIRSENVLGTPTFKFVRGEEVLQ